jgi:hypothetical protein
MGRWGIDTRFANSLRSVRRWGFRPSGLLKTRLNLLPHSLQIFLAHYPSGKSMHSRRLERNDLLVIDNKRDTIGERPLRNRQVASSTLALGSSFSFGNQ